MVSMDPENVVYASSFSKTVCPGIRVGYLVGPADLIARIVKLATSTYISPNMVAQGIVNQFARSGSDRRLDRDGQGRSARARRRALPRRSSVSSPTPASSSREGGYFLWVELPRGTDVGALFDAAAERGVQFVKGTDFVLEGDESSLRLAYSGVTPRRSRRASRAWPTPTRQSPPAPAPASSEPFAGCPGRLAETNGRPAAKDVLLVTCLRSRAQSCADDRGVVAVARRIYD